MPVAGTSRSPGFKKMDKRKRGSLQRVPCEFGTQRVCAAHPKSSPTYSPTDVPPSSLSKKSATSSLLTPRETKPLPFIANTSRFLSNSKRLFRACCCPNSGKRILLGSRALSAPPSPPGGGIVILPLLVGLRSSPGLEARVRPPALVMPSCGCFLFGKIESGPGVL